MLSPYRVLDLTDESGLLCGMALADLGADVIQIEPPGGSTARRVGPHLKDETGPERSLFFRAYARNKRGLVLDLESREGRDRLLGLVDGADFLIESARPGRMAELGLGYDALAARNPALIYVSISPFGQAGPKAQYAATDLIVAAASGLAHLNGDADHPPVRVSVPQAHAHAGADAAVGALIAHFERKRSGRGQHVDVSAQDSLTFATMFRALDTPLEQTPARRGKGGILVAGSFLRSRYQLADGWVVLGPGVIPSTGHFMKRLQRWMLERGEGRPEWVEEDWGAYAMRLIRGERSQQDWDPVEQALDAFFRGFTKVELMAEVVRRKLLMAPILDVREIVESEQLAERGAIVPVPDPLTGQPERHPGPAIRFEESPIRFRRRAPRLDEHRRELEVEPPRTRVASGMPPTDVSDEAPLAGVKILDFFWVLAGPGSTRMLADYGATCVRVESARHLDTLRVIPPYLYNESHPEHSGAFESANANKLCITLDVGNPAARPILEKLVAWADVVTESFAPGVLARYGLDYQSLRAIKPDLIVLSSCLMGQTGPWRDFTGFGNLAASVTGFQQLAGWPGQPPAGPWGAYTDFIAARYNALAILGALEYRDRTGRGQYVDQSQAEAALQFLAPALLDYTTNGRIAGEVGNLDPDLSPHDVYPCAGADAWVAIVAQSDAAWEALCTCIGREDLRGRRLDRERVDSAIGDWTRVRTPPEAEAELQSCGVAAHAVLDMPGLFADPQLRLREHYQPIEHHVFPTSCVESSRLLLSRSRPRRPERSTPFGRDNRYVLETLLGYAPEQIAAFAAAGLLL